MLWLYVLRYVPLRLSVLRHSVIKSPCKPVMLGCVDIFSPLLSMLILIGFCISIILSVIFNLGEVTVANHAIYIQIKTTSHVSVGSIASLIS